MWTLIHGALIKPAKEFLAFILLLAGFLFIVMGSVFGAFIEALPFFPVGSADVLVKAGGGILGAGVFAVIMKSAQFTEYFKKNIYEVFYAPGEQDSVDALKFKWEKLTRSLLSGTLPASHQSATSVILARFFDNELEFHFEDFQAFYEFSLSDDKKTIKVKYSIKADAVVSPGYDEVEIKQRIATEGGVKLISLILDNKPIDIDQHLVRDTEKQDVHHFSLKINPKSSKGNSQDRRVSIERVYEFEQDITKEPYHIATFERYVKGFVVRAKFNGCKLYFSSTGTKADPEVTVDSQGERRWVLADRDTLLLPGEGYIFIVTV